MVMDTPQYWAFAETVARTRNRVRARFDLLPGQTLETLAGARDHGRDEHFTGMETPVLTVDAEGPAREELLHRGAGPLRESSWYGLNLGREGVAGALHADLAATEGDHVQLERLERIDGRSHTGRMLREVFSLADLPQVGGDEIPALFQQVMGQGDLRVCVYDVGQGNAQAVCDGMNVPLVYFDLGGGCAWNAKTYPPSKRKRFCWTDDPAIVLSHWDFDHYFSGTFLEESHKRTWLVPSQGTIGPTPRKMLSKITFAGGRVLVWSQGPWQVNVGPLTLARPAPTSTSKNHSGIVMRVDLPNPVDSAPWPVLLTGDLSYKYLPPVLSQDLEALVAGHHGASRYMGTPPATAGQGIVAYSFGAGNTYKHPKPVALQRHVTQGWGKRLDTTNGNIVMAPVPAVHPVGCGGAQCGLNPVQQ